MAQLTEQTLQFFTQPAALELLTKIQHGIEKESLRTTADARLSQELHPKALGSTLTHPSITTDYSEALLEFITPVYTDVQEALDHLRRLHCYTYHQIGNEMLWVNSMPSVLEGNARIPIAHYGNSNVGRMKAVYREGLANRYDKAMQTIAGIHYNLSLPAGFWELLHQEHTDDRSLQDLQSDGYFSLIRNFRRYSWLLMYLFGASPALSKSFLGSRPHHLQELDADTLYLPYATSLRMSDLGYQSDAQSSLNICFNGLDTYTATLRKAISTPYPAYQELGLKDEQGNYLQLNTNLLQIENEYYSSIRPKRITLSGEKPVCALSSRGVEYIEVRCLDLDPFVPLGISSEQSHFLDAFLLFCALADSPAITDSECEALNRNFQLVVSEGRKPGLELSRQEQPIELAVWGERLLTQISGAATLLDRAHGSSHYGASVLAQMTKINNPEQTPSARVLQTLRDNQQSFIEFGVQTALQHRQNFSTCHLTEEQIQQFQQQAKQSISDQLEIEQQDTLSFEEYLEQYFQQD